ncbi:DUF3927 family protein [Escherichia coli]|uniref:DUF3927 family protein n=2 Tax=Escherichia coli TaxID=562 RepID=UPI0002E74321|nr:DUF3927 family protein [Escherichia coli]
MTVKLRLTVAALLLFLVVMVDFTSRIMSVLADGVLVCGIMVLLWPVIKETACICLIFCLLFIKNTYCMVNPPVRGAISQEGIWGNRGFRC